jgi:coproporphyrinogen III oxidase
VGGIFFDYLNDRPAKEIFAFVQAVGEAYVDVYPRILSRRVEMPFTTKQKDEQLYWRGRYAEFNLVYDRGTKFGLMTGGNIEAIFVSMPPVVKW